MATGLKILLTSRELPPAAGGGGIGTYVSAMARALAALGHEVHVLTCSAENQHADALEAGVHVHRRALPSLPGLTALASRVRLTMTLGRLVLGYSVFREYRQLGSDFDVVECPDWGAEGWLLAWLKRKPLVVHLHSPLPLLSIFGGSPPTIDGRLAGSLEGWTARQARVLTAPSALLVDWARRLGFVPPSGGVEVIPYPIDDAVFAEVRPVIATSPTVLFVGRLQTLKAPEILIDAMKAVRRRLPEATAILVGRSVGTRDGLEYGRWLAERAGPDSGCVMVGEKSAPEVRALLSDARVCVLTSHYDSFPNVTLEAMASARPVVVTATSGVAPLVQEGRAGQVVEAGASGALAEALYPYLSDAALAAREGENGRRVVRTRLAPSLVAQERTRIYRIAMEKQRDHQMSRTRGYPHALARTVGSLGVPTSWRQAVTSEATAAPWMHFYLRTADQLLQLLAGDTSLRLGSDLSGWRVLDVGCTPVVSVMLAALGARVTLLDVEPGELRKGISWARRLEIQDRVDVVRGDAFALPTRSGAYDLVWNSGFLEHFDAPERLLREMRRSVATNGRLAVLVPARRTPHSLWIRERLRRQASGYPWDYMGRERSYGTQDLERLVRESGFRVLGSSTANLRRSVLDDSIILPWLSRLPLGGIFKLFNLVDWIERRVPPTRWFGFTSGVLAAPNLETGTS